MEVIVRNMKVSDVSNVVKFDIIMMGETLGEKVIQEHIENSSIMKYFIMETKEDKQFIGQISLWIDDNKAQINNFYIIKKYQSQKFGRKFMDFVFSYFKMLNIFEITLEVRKSNSKAINLYESYGFKEILARYNYYPNGEDALLMYLKIGSE